MDRKIKEIHYSECNYLPQILVKCEDDTLWWLNDLNWQRIQDIPDEKEDNVYLKDRIESLEKTLSLIGTKADDKNPLSPFHNSRNFIIKEITFAKNKIKMEC